MARPQCDTPLVYLVLAFFFYLTVYREPTTYKMDYKGEIGY